MDVHVVFADVIRHNGQLWGVRLYQCLSQANAKYDAGNIHLLIKYAMIYNAMPVSFFTEADLF